ncbi:MAG: hypothetical protein AAFR46_15175 [Pseudomonadota bacterium]
MDRHLDRLLAELAADAPQPDPALLARIAADADRLAPASPVAAPRAAPRAAPHRRRRDLRWVARSRLSEQVRVWGGWQGAAALGCCLLAGLWFGLAAPDTVRALGQVTDSRLFEYDFPLSGMGDALSGMSMDREI